MYTIMIRLCQFVQAWTPLPCAGGRQCHRFACGDSEFYIKLDITIAANVCPNMSSRGRVWCKEGWFWMHSLRISGTGVVFFNINMNNHEYMFHYFARLRPTSLFRSHPTMGPEGALTWRTEHQGPISTGTHHVLSNQLSHWKSRWCTSHRWSTAQLKTVRIAHRWCNIGCYTGAIRCMIQQVVESES